MSLKHKWPIWAPSWTCLVCSKHGVRWNHLPRARCKFTDALTLQVLVPVTSPGLDPLLCTSTTGKQRHP